MKKTLYILLAILLIVISVLMLKQPDNKSVVIVNPIEPDRKDIGYYCSMIVVDHPGPKAQIWLKDKNKPLWFSSVRDAMIFILSPEEEKHYKGVYVNDMGSDNIWQKPNKDTWIDAYKAIYVINSSLKGGMGMEEIVPFTNVTEANKFIKKFGGKIIGGIENISQDHLLKENTPAQHDVKQMNMEHNNIKPLH